MESNIIYLLNFLSSLGFKYLLILSPETFSSNQLPLVPPVHSFGDSLFDSGNNNYLMIQARANFTPYGIDFVNGPTERFTNNKTAVDLFAEKLGLSFAPPYFGLAGKLMPLSGVNYASAAWGILDGTGQHMGESLLGTNLPGSKIVVNGASFELALNRNLNPTQYGFEAQNKPFCEVNFEREALSEDRRSTDISFDAIHSTDAIYSIFANSRFDGSPSICSDPLTRKQPVASRGAEYSSY